MTANSKDSPARMYLYWFPEDKFLWAKNTLIDKGMELSSSPLTPCQVLHASGNKVTYATPGVWSRICVRQGSWYRNSKRFGQYMMMSENKLADIFDDYLDVEISETDFVPKALATTQQLQDLVDSDVYNATKPTAWEAKGIKDSFMFKVIFTLTGFWGWGDNLKKYWLSHKANHANFLARHFTTRIDGEDVAYSVSDNAGVCSSCVETFNIIDPDARKLVRACPGAVTFGGARRDIYIDVRPIKRPGTSQEVPDS